MGDSELGPSLVTFALLAMATSDLALRSSRVEHWILFFPCCLRAVDMVVLLCDGWASASRRSYTHSSLRVDCDTQPPQSHQYLYRFPSQPIPLISLNLY